MKSISTLLALWASVAACGSAPASETATTTTAVSAAAATTSTTIMEPTATPPAAPRYDIRGIFDPGLGGMVAFAFKVPHGWTVQQSFTRRWIDNYPVEELYSASASPGGHTVFEALPQLLYGYIDDPQMQQMIRLGEQQSGQHDKSFVAPLLPMPYLKQVLLPLLAQQAKLQVRVVGEHQDPVQTDPQTHSQLATGYVDAVLPNGRRLRLKTRLVVFSNPTPTATAGRMATIYNWTADNLIIQTDGDLATAIAQQATLEKSVAVNPEWARQNAALKQRGADANNKLRQQQTQQMLRQSQERIYAQRQQFAQHHASWVAQQRANGQVAEAFSDYLGGRTMYQNPDTGERMKVDNAYSHVYQDGQGHTLATNAPLSAGNVNWQELQQVELKNY